MTCFPLYDLKLAISSFSRCPDIVFNKPLKEKKILFTNIKKNVYNNSFHESQNPQLLSEPVTLQILFLPFILSLHFFHLFNHTRMPSILKTLVCCVTHPKHCMVCFPNLFLIHSFSTLLIRLFTIAFIKCSVHIYLSFIYFSSFI